MCVIFTLILAFETVLMIGYNKLLFGKFEENFLIFLEGDIKRISQNYKQKSGFGTNDNVESKWEYFNALTLLRDTIKARKSHSTLVGFYTNLSYHGIFPYVLK